MPGSEVSGRSITEPTKLSLTFTVLMFGAVLFRFFDLNNPILIAVAALAPWFLAFGVFVTAVLHDWKLGVVAALVVGLVGVAALPGDIAPRTGCDVGAGRMDDHLVIASQNVLFGSPLSADVADQLSELEPDVVILQEAEPAFVQGVLDALDGSFEHTHQSEFQAILSRLPLSDVDQLRSDDNPVHTLLLATATTPSGPLSLVNVHAAPPHVPGERENQRAQFVSLAEWSSEVPLLAIGDFNSVQADRAFRTLQVDGGLVDAHNEAGCGFGVTWSPVPRVGLALLGLDHALVGQGWEADAFEILDYEGSDHQAIVVRIQPV